VMKTRSQLQQQSQQSSGRKASEHPFVVKAQGWSAHKTVVELAGWSETIVNLERSVKLERSVVVAIFAQRSSKSPSTRVDLAEWI
jgi:hypothetical protein